MKLNAYLADKAITEFDVARVEHTVTETGEKIAVLWLKTPIPVVQGSQRITDDATGESVRLESYDVESVRIHQRDFESDGIDINEDGTGKVKTDLRLDVSNGDDVWLTSESFASFGRKKRQENATNRKSGIVAKMNERKAASTFKDGAGTSDKEQPEAVAAAKPVAAGKVK